MYQKASTTCSSVGTLVGWFYSFIISSVTGRTSPLAHIMLTYMYPTTRGGPTVQKKRSTYMYVRLALVGGYLHVDIVMLYVGLVAS